MFWRKWSYAPTPQLAYLYLRMGKNELGMSEG
jgi:hypothetical protein